MSAFLNVDEDVESPRVAEPYFTASPPAHPDPGTQQLIRPATSPEPAKPKLVLIAPARRRGTSSSGGAQNGSESVVIDYGRRRTTCGYCRSSGPTSISHGTDFRTPSDETDSLCFDLYRTLKLCCAWNRPLVLL